MQVDAIETGSHYQLEIALPGVRKGECRVFHAHVLESLLQAAAGRTAWDTHASGLAAVPAWGSGLTGGQMGILQRICAWSSGAPS